MARVEVVSTRLGDVEVVRVEGPGPAVLFFPGGHCSAVCDCGWDLYTRLGYSIVSFSRPGYGGTRVGDLSATEFVPAVEEVCTALGVTEVAAVVGVSFGALQAVPVALSPKIVGRRLVLHSGAPSTLAYPDRWVERLAAPVAFGPRAQRGVWAAISRAVRTDAGLRAMCASLSTLPVEQWWSSWSAADRERARSLFQAMRSGRGFVNDVRQASAGSSRYRRWMLQQVACPTLITGSRYDGGVAYAHAEDFATWIPRAQLVELPSPTHLFWLGPEAKAAERVVQEFLEGTD